MFAQIGRCIAVADRSEQLLRAEQLHHRLIRIPAQRCRPSGELDLSYLSELHGLLKSARAPSTFDLTTHSFA
jgi:hypothetical protein